MHYQGSCHCGDITFEAEGEIDHAIECNCSFCSRKGTLLWFVPRAKFKLNSGEDKATLYKFNKHRRNPGQVEFIRKNLTAADSI